MKPALDLERFAADVLPHPLLAQLRGPVFGYAGVVDRHIDVALIAALAAAFPEGHVALVGPVREIDPKALPRRTNVHLTGAVPYDALPSWLAGFDVALMPFAGTHAAEVMSPATVQRYLAAGKRVVATGIAGVPEECSDAVYIADSPEAFVAAVREALKDALEER